jgi:hypothetical protein
MGSVQYVETPESKLKLRFMKVLDMQLPEMGPVAVELLAKELILAIPEPVETTIEPSPTEGA